jgi:hypothetical protein
MKGFTSNGKEVSQKEQPSLHVKESADSCVGLHFSSDGCSKFLLGYLKEIFGKTTEKLETVQNILSSSEGSPDIEELTSLLIAISNDVTRIYESHGWDLGAFKKAFHNAKPSISKSLSLVENIREYATEKSGDGKATKSLDKGVLERLDRIYGRIESIVKGIEKGKIEEEVEEEVKEEEVKVPIYRRFFGLRKK